MNAFLACQLSKKCTTIQLYIIMNNSNTIIIHIQSIIWGAHKKNSLWFEIKVRQHKKIFWPDPKSSPLSVSYTNCIHAVA